MTVRSPLAPSRARSRMLRPAFDRLEPRDVPALLLVGGAVAGQASDPVEHRSDLTVLGDADGLRGVVGTTQGTATVFALSTGRKATTVVGMQAYTVAPRGVAGTSLAASGTTPGTSPDDPAAPVTVRILPSPGEGLGDPVRIDLVAGASVTYAGNDVGEVDRSLSYTIRYSNVPGVTVTLADGSDASHAAVERKGLQEAKAGFDARIGDEFSIYLRVEARTTAPVAINPGPQRLGVFASANLTMTASAPAATPGPARPPLAVAPPTLASARVVRTPAGKAKATVVRLTFSQALDPGRAGDRGNYAAVLVPGKPRGKHSVERFRVVRVASASYNATTGAVDLTFRGQRVFERGGQITAKAGAPGASTGLAAPSGLHLAGDGIHEGTDASARVRG